MNIRNQTVFTGDTFGNFFQMSLNQSIFKKRGKESELKQPMLFEAGGEEKRER